MRRITIAMAVATALGASAPVDAGSTCDPSETCCVLACSGSTELPTTEECLSDACACAQQIHCVIEERQPEWPLYPDSGEFQPTARPVHGRYLTIRVNPTAESGLATFAPGMAGPVEMPHGAVIVKSNFIPDPSSPGVPNPDPDDAAITSMIKLDGYCPETSGAFEDCVGGEWFYLLRTGDLFPIFGSPGGCANCHSAAQNADWLWRLFAARRFGPESDLGDGR